MGLWDREKKAFGNDVQTKENPMSRNNSLRLRAALTLGATALALCVTTGPSLAAGGHEGHAAGIAATRGGDREGMRGGMNERMNSLRVETLSPAGFVSRSPFVGTHVFPQRPQADSPADGSRARATHPQVVSNPPQVDSKPPQVVSNPPQVVSNPPQVVSNPPQVVSNPPQVDSKPPQVVSNPPQVVSNPPHAVSAGQGLIQDPLKQAQPMAVGGHGLIQDPLKQAQPMAVGGHGVIQDPLKQAQPMA